MRSKMTIVGIWLLSCLGTAALADPIRPAVAPPDEAAGAAPLIVNVRHMNGDRETLVLGIDSVDLIFDGSGQLVMVHIVLLSDGKPDTHRWLPMQNLASFSYRILNRSGQSKVRLRTLQPLDKTHADGVAPSTANDYR